MSTQRISDRFTCRHIPESDRLVRTPARQSLPVGAECDAYDLMTPARQGFPVGAERDVHDLIPRFV